MEIGKGKKGENQPARHKAVREVERKIRRCAALPKISQHSTKPQLPMCNPIPQLVSATTFGPPRKESSHTQSTAKNTSVTLNLLSTLHGAPTGSAPPSSKSSSPMKVSAHRRPHQAAGAVLKALQNSSGKCQCFPTPSKTATRGCRTEVLVSGLAGCWRGVGGEGGEDV